jgi:hypothetical protein
MPARLDSVKFIGNRFRGGLGVKTAEMLRELGHEVTLLYWKHSGISSTELPAVEVEDVVDYLSYIKNVASYDGYVMAAAVANLMPVKPWRGKFPSHNYEEGEVFPVDFKITPRIINEIKKRQPRVPLVGYKLFDGSGEELIKAARHVVDASKSNIVFANTPANAKTEKLAVLPDGSVQHLSFDEHVYLIDKLLRTSWFRTEPSKKGKYLQSRADQEVIDKYPKTEVAGKTFGTFAIRTTPDGGFLTTSRGKQIWGPVSVLKVDMQRRVVYASDKATLNAPLLGRILQANPNINYILHGHSFLADAPFEDYEFPGTLEEAKLGASRSTFNIRHHGYVASFETRQEALDFLESGAGRERGLD